MFGFFKKKPKPTGPDFSGIDSREKAVVLFEKGELEKFFLMPLQFGGEDNPMNALFVPVGLKRVADQMFDDVLTPMIEKGTVSQYKAVPEYQGNSFIPIAIKITAWNPGEFTTTINIWGEALGRE